MSHLLVLAADGSTHPIVAAADASQHAARRLTPAEAGAVDVDIASSSALVVVDRTADDNLVALIEAIAPDRPVIVAPDPALLHLLADRLPAATAGRVIVGCTARFEPVATAIAGSVATGTLGLAWGIHVEGLGDSRPAAEVAVDMVDLAAHLTAARLLGVERLGAGTEPLVLVPELQHGIVASITILPARAGGESATTAPSTLLRIDSSHGQASADLLSPVLRAAGGPRRFGPTGNQLFLDAALAGSAPADLRLPAVLERLAPVLASLL